MPRNHRTRRPTTAFVHLRLRSDPSVVLRLHSPELAAAAARQATSRRAAAAPFVCEDFVNGRLCAAGAECADVHVDVSDATALHPHTTTMAADESQPRLGRPGEQIRLVAPVTATEGVTPAAAGSPSIIAVDATQCLLTDVPSGASETPAGRHQQQQQQLSICAHFAQKGVCDFGATCRFVHALPSVFSASKCKKRGHRLGASALSNTVSVAMVGPWNADGSDDVGAAAAAAPLLAGSFPVLSSQLVSPKSTTSGCAAASVGAPACSAPHATGLVPVQRRFRHEPYGARGWVAAAPAKLTA